MLKTALHITNIATLKDKSVKITASTPELKPEAMTELFRMSGSEVAVIFQKSENDQTMVENVALPVDGGKSPSTRLRNTIFVGWKENTDQEEPFDSYYIRRMEQHINEEKSELPDRESH